MDNIQPPKPTQGIPPPSADNSPQAHLPNYAPPPPEEMGTGKVVGLSALACCIPLVGPIISLTIGIVERAKRGAVTVIVIAGISLVGLPVYGIVAAIAIGVPMPSHRDATETEIRENMNKIHIGLERYAVDENGTYPADIYSLVVKGYIEEFPLNPFSGEPMVLVRESDSPSIREGNFSFSPIYQEDLIFGFKLIGYGSVDSENPLFSEREDVPGQAVFWRTSRP